MRLYLFKLSNDIPVEDMERVGDNIGKALGIDFSVFDQPIARSIEEVTVEDLLRISDQFLDRGEPVVAIVFARSGIVDDEAILGQGSEPHRGAWVRWTDDVRQTTLIALHELGHIMDADHCSLDTCLMFHILRDHDGKELKLEELFCNKCNAVTRGSWVYTRLTHSAQHRAQQGRFLPHIVNRRIDTPGNIPIGPTQVRPSAPIPNVPTRIPTHNSDSGSSFPSWDLAYSNPSEFIRQVKEHFGFRG